jgi:serine/threonine protein kinase
MIIWRREWTKHLVFLHSRGELILRPSKYSICFFIVLYRHEGYGTIPYTAPEIVGAVPYHKSAKSSVPDAWSWGAVLYRVTYDIPPTYKEPCYQPPHGKKPSRDPNVVDVLKHTLVSDPSHRVSSTWLAAHRYSSM